VPDIAAIGLLVVPTIGFRLLCGLAIIHLERRRLDWINANPTAGWIACQITEAFPWNQAPPVHYSRLRWCLWRRRHPEDPSDGHSGLINCAPFTMEEWTLERLVGSIPRECLDHVMVLG